jgi:hypothetical protein
MQASQRVTDLSINVSFERGAEAFDEPRGAGKGTSGEGWVARGEG